MKSKSSPQILGGEPNKHLLKLQDEVILRHEIEIRVPFSKNLPETTHNPSKIGDDTNGSTTSLPTIDF